MQGSVYQKTNAMSEIRKTNKDTFWAQAEVRPQTPTELTLTSTALLRQSDELTSNP